MEQLVQVKNAVLAGISALGGWLISALGGWDVTLEALVAFMAADYITGLLAAGVFHRSNKTETGALESRAGFKGLVRKCAVLLLVLLAALLDEVTGTGFIRPAVCLFFLSNEGISVLENLGLMGVPYPRRLRQALEALRRQAEQDGPDEKEGGDAGDEAQRR